MADRVREQQERKEIGVRQTWHFYPWLHSLLTIPQLICSSVLRVGDHLPCAPCTPSTEPRAQLTTAGAL